MYRLNLMAATYLVITACASSGPNLASAPAPEAAEPPSKSEATEPESVVEVATIPGVPATTVDHGADSVAVQNEMVCRREMRTGSHRATRVCRTRAEIERMEIDAKDTFKDLHRSQKEFE